MDEDPLAGDRIPYFHRYGFFSYLKVHDLIPVLVICSSPSSMSISSQVTGFNYVLCCKTVCSYEKTHF